MKPFHLIFTTFEKVVFEGNVISLIAPGSLGYLEILASHAPFITSLEKGIITITETSGEKKVFPITGGLLHVFQNEVALLGD